MYAKFTAFPSHRRRDNYVALLKIHWVTYNQISLPSSWKGSIWGHSRSLVNHLWMATVLVCHLVEFAPTNGNNSRGTEFCRRHSTCFSIEHYLFSCSSTCWFHRQLLLISWCAQILPGCAPEVRHKAVRISCRPDRSMMIAAVSVLPIIRVLSAIGIHGFLIRSAKLLIFVGQMSECTVMHSLGSHFTGLHSISPCRTFQITSKLGT